MYKSCQHELWAIVANKSCEHKLWTRVGKEICKHKLKTNLWGTKIVSDTYELKAGTRTRVFNKKNVFHGCAMAEVTSN